MMPFHDAWPWALGCAVVAAVSLLLWSQAAQRAFLVAMAAALVGGVGCLLADWLVVTDREQIEILFPRLARAAETGDTSTILAALDPALAPLRSEAEQACGSFVPRRCGSRASMSRFGGRRLPAWPGLKCSSTPGATPAALAGPADRSRHSSISRSISARMGGDS